MACVAAIEHCLSPNDVQSAILDKMFAGGAGIFAETVELMYSTLSVGYDFKSFDFKSRF